MKTAIRRAGRRVNATWAPVLAVVPAPVQVRLVQHQERLPAPAVVGRHCGGATVRGAAGRSVGTLALRYYGGSRHGTRSTLQSLACPRYRPELGKRWSRCARGALLRRATSPKTATLASSRSGTNGAKRA